MSTAPAPNTIHKSLPDHRSYETINKSHKNILIVGSNGALLSNDGKTKAVISRDFYSNKKSFEERLTMFFLLKKAIEKNNSEIEKVEHTNLMHVRKVKIKI